MTNADRSHVLAAMKHAGAPLTRDEFLNWFYMGEVPDAIPAEDEASSLSSELASLNDTLTERIQ